MQQQHEKLNANDCCAHTYPLSCPMTETQNIAASFYLLHTSYRLWWVTILLEKKIFTNLLSLDLTIENRDEMRNKKLIKIHVKQNFLEK